MKQPPPRLFDKPPIEGAIILRAKRPPVPFYRYLYNCVGEPWLWYMRRKIDDEALCAIIHDENVEVYVLYVSGVPAGYVELDRRSNNEVELAYFGLLPEFIGRGLGSYLLDWALSQAWCTQPERVWVHTCNLDHPKALEIYQRAGFVSYKQETTRIDDPRLDGTIAPSSQ